MSTTKYVVSFSLGRLPPKMHFTNLAFVALGATVVAIPTAQAVISHSTNKFSSPASHPPVLGTKQVEVREAWGVAGESRSNCDREKADLPSQASDQGGGHSRLHRRASMGLRWYELPEAVFESRVWQRNPLYVFLYRDLKEELVRVEILNAAVAAFFSN